MPHSYSPLLSSAIQICPFSLSVSSRAHALQPQVIAGTVKNVIQQGTNALENTGKKALAALPDMTADLFAELMAGLLHIVRRKDISVRDLLSQLVKVVLPNRDTIVHEVFSVLKQAFSSLSAPLSDKHITLLLKLYSDSKKSDSEWQKDCDPLLPISRNILALSGLTRDDTAIEDICSTFGMMPDTIEMFNR